MKLDSAVKQAREFIHPFRVTDGSDFKLKDVDPGETLGYGSEDKPRAKEVLANGVEALAALQDMLYAQDRWALLLVFQAMDAAGKDGAIKHVMTGINPQGCQVYAFKSPNSEELDHDFLWRVWRALPERGRIGIWNRSHYEEVLVVRVNPGFVDHQKLPHRPEDLADLWAERYESIAAAEKHWARNGCVILKFFLNVSQKEQHKRFLERVTDPEHFWKFSSTDMAESKKWEAYMEAYQDALAATSKPWAPWYAIPADSKHLMRRLVTDIIVGTLGKLDLHYPELPEKELAALGRVRDELEAE